MTQGETYIRLENLPGEKLSGARKRRRYAKHLASVLFGFVTFGRIFQTAVYVVEIKLETFSRFFCLFAISNMGMCTEAGKRGGDTG